MDRHLYAVERYGPPGRLGEPEPEPMPAEPSRIVGVMQLTDDDVAVALVEGPDPESVRASMVAAGWRVDRITSARWTTFESKASAGGRAPDPATRGEEIGR